jgi:cytochrome P450
MAEPPGPRGTQLFSVLNDWRKNQVTSFERLAQRYGDVVCLKLPLRRICVVSHPDHVRHVLIGNYDNYLKPKANAHAQLYFGTSMQLRNGEEARRLRRAINPVFLQSMMTHDYCETVVQATRAAVQTWAAGVRPTLQHDLMELALLVAVQIHFGTAPGDDTAALAAHFREIQHHLSGALPPGWLPLPSVRRYRETVARLDRDVYGLIAQRRASGSIGVDLLSRFVSQPEGLSDREIRDELLSMMSAGYVSIGIALGQMVQQIASHPEVDEALRREVSEVLGPRPATHHDLAKLPYSEQVVKEVLRVAPPAGVVARRVVAADQIGGWDIRAGSQLFASAWALHRDPRWFDEPHRFKPDRWTADFEYTLPACAYLPFGRGPRSCIAGGLSMMILRLVLVTLMQKYRLRTPDIATPSAPVRFDLTGSIPQPGDGTQAPGSANDVPVVLEERVSA